jgi:hypothetical protein
MAQKVFESIDILWTHARLAARVAGLWMHRANKFISRRSEAQAR